jgi:hypothetical protein
VNIHVLSIVRPLLYAFNVAQRFHGFDGTEGGGFHHTCQIAQLFLRSAIRRPENSQKSPVAEGHIVFLQAALEVVLLNARAVSRDQMRQTIVGHRFVPVLQNALRVARLS